MRLRLTLLLCLLSLGLAQTAIAGWDPLQKAERAALKGARRFAAGDSLGAVESLLKAQALSPDDTRIRMGLAEALYNNGEYRSAQGQWHLAGERDDEYETSALYNAGNAAFEMGELEKALDNYTAALVAGDTDPDLLHNLELAQTLLEQAQQQQQENQDGEPQEGEEGEEQEQQEGQQQEQQEGEQQQEQEQQEGEPEEQEGEPEEQEGEGEQEQEQPEAAAQPDSMPPMPAMADSLSIPEGMTAEQAMRLLDALDHDEEELRRSIQRRLKRGEKASENDW